MNQEAKFGSKINLSVIRANGKREDFGDFYNHPRLLFLSSTSGHIRGFSTGSLAFRASSDVPVVQLTGTWSQSGTTVSRVSGSDTLPLFACFYKFADGSEPGVRVSGTGTSITVTRSGTVAAQVLYYFLETTPTSSQELASVPSTRSYSAGVVTISNTSAVNFAPASSAYTLRLILQSQSGTVNAEAVVIQINPPIAIDVGDQIVINSYEYKFDYGQHTPRAFAVSPISGLTGSGRAQRLRRINIRDAANSPNRIWLITDANKITIPDMLGFTDTVLNPASYTMAETITATGSVQTPAVGNDYTDGHSCSGTTAIGGTIKQIAWGSTTEIFGIIEYDTPVTIATGKTLTVGMSTKLVPVLTLP